MSPEFAQARPPERFIVAQPVVDRAQRLRVELANARRAVSTGDDQACRSQQAKVLGDRRTAGAKIQGELADRMSTTTQQPEYLPPGRIGNRPKDDFVLLAAFGNHLDTVTRRLRTVKCATGLDRGWPGTVGLQPRLKPYQSLAERMKGTAR